MKLKIFMPCLFNVAFHEIDISIFISGKIRHAMIQQLKFERKKSRILGSHLQEL